MAMAKRMRFGWESSRGGSDTLEELERRRDFILQERDLRIVESLGRYHYLDAALIGRMHFADGVAVGAGQCGSAEKKAQTRMAKLFRVGLVQRAAISGRTKPRFVYVLDKLGVSLVDEGFPAGYGWRPPFMLANNKANPFHELEVNRIALSLVEYARERGLYYEWVGSRDAYHRVRVNAPGSKPLIVEPDAVVVIGDHTLTVEYERSMHRTRLKGKLARWRAYQAMGAWREKWPSRPTMLLVAEESRFRQDEGLARAEEMAGLLRLIRNDMTPRVVLAGASCALTGEWLVVDPRVSGARERDLLTVLGEETGKEARG